MQEKTISKTALGVKSVTGVTGKCLRERIALTAMNAITHRQAETNFTSLNAKLAQIAFRSAIQTVETAQSAMAATDL